jgi:demethylmenaquinone methyltransferase/2-methoxy-6-polyprenyl-1,4-benzoquinol methylase
VEAQHDRARAVTTVTPAPGTPQRDAVRGMFDRIALRYDFLTHCFSAGFDRRWRCTGVDALALASGARLLDLCTGTADVLVEWLKRDPHNRGVGIDLSSRMLQLGQEKLVRQGWAGRGTLISADAEHLPFAAEALDGAIVAFGLRNVAERSVVLREVAGALRPGAAFVVLELGWPRGLLGRAYALYFCHVLPRVGGWLSGDAGAYAYLPESVRVFPRSTELMAELRAAGFAEVEGCPMTAGIVWLYRAVKPR